MRKNVWKMKSMRLVRIIPLNLEYRVIFYRFIFHFGPQDYQNDEEIRMLVDFMLEYEYSIKYVYKAAPLYKNGASKVLYSITITPADLRLYL